MTSRLSNTWKWLWLFLAVILTGGIACNLSSMNAPEPDVTLTALSQSVLGTATAAAAEKNSEDDQELATAQAEATQDSQAVVATQTARASTRDEAALVTSTAAAPVVAELPRYGIEPGEGSLGWVHPPVKVEIEGYHQYGFANDYMQVVVRDFVLAADITWDTQYGASGCGYMFRSNGDQKKPSQYMIITTRLGNGHVIFTAMAGGELANVQDFYAGYLDPSFGWENGTTNRLVIVGRGSLFDIYTNGVKLGTVDTTQPPPTPVLPKAPKAPSDQTDLAAVQNYRNRLKEYEDMVGQVQSNYQIALEKLQDHGCSI